MTARQGVRPSVVAGLAGFVFLAAACTSAYAQPRSMLPADCTSPAGETTLSLESRKKEIEGRLATLRERMAQVGPIKRAPLDADMRKGAGRPARNRVRRRLSALEGAAAGATSAAAGFGRTQTGADGQPRPCTSASAGPCRRRSAASPCCGGSAAGRGAPLQHGRSGHAKRLWSDHGEVRNG